MQPDASVRVVRYSIDDVNVIISVSDEWERFAVENGAQALSRADVAGRSLWDFICDMETRYLYELLFERVRNTGTSFTVPFRCDAPDRRRFMELEVRAEPEFGLGLTARLLAEELRPRLAILDVGVERSDELIFLCGWCKRVRLDEETWNELEEAIARLGLFEQSVLPGISHVTCPTCAARIES